MRQRLASYRVVVARERGSGAGAQDTSVSAGVSGQGENGSAAVIGRGSVDGLMEDGKGLLKDVDEDDDEEDDDDDDSASSGGSDAIRVSGIDSEGDGEGEEDGDQEDGQVGS